MMKLLSVLLSSYFLDSILGVADTELYVPQGEY